VDATIEQFLALFEQSTSKNWEVRKRVLEDRRT
jgi:hypothetical protein